MRLSKQQKVYLAILALALGALLVDRLFRSRQTVTAEASASSELLAGHTRDPSPVTSDPMNERRATSGELAQRLEILWPDEYLGLDQARDAFSLPAAWLDELCAQNPLVEGDAAAQFTKTHQLNAVLIDGKMRSALVDGHLLIPGQELDDFKLIAIDESSATFAAGTKRVILRLKTDR